MSSFTYNTTSTDLEDLYKQREGVTHDILRTERRAATLRIEMEQCKSKRATHEADLKRAASDFAKNRQVQDMIDLQTATIVMKWGNLKRQEALQKNLEEKKERIQQQIETAEEAAPAPKAAEKCHMSSAEIQKRIDELDSQREVLRSRIRVCTGNLRFRAYTIDRNHQKSIQPLMDLRGQTDAIDAERATLVRELEGAMTRESKEESTAITGANALAIEEEGMKIAAPEVTAALIDPVTLTTVSIMIAKAVEEARAQVVMAKLAIAFACLVTMDATNEAEFEEAMAAATNKAEFEEAERIADEADAEAAARLAELLL